MKIMLFFEWLLQNIIATHERDVLQSAFISQVAENEIVGEACLVIQDLQFCSWGLEKCRTKDREFGRVNIVTVAYFIAAGARQPNSRLWSFIHLLNRN